MEKSRNFQIDYAGCTNLSKQTDRPLTKLGFPQPPHYPIGVKQAGKTNLFHMRRGRFHAGNTLCTFNKSQQLNKILQHTLLYA